jgi:transcriptional regulator with XRE-family HTH domain
MPKANTRPYHVLVRVQNNRLLQLRREAGLTQEDLAMQIGVSSCTYGNLENLRTFPHYKNGDWRHAAIELADYWGVQLDWLFPASIIEGQVNRMVAELGPKELDNMLRHIGAFSPSRVRAA